MAAVGEPISYKHFALNRFINKSPCTWQGQQKLTYIITNLRIIFLNLRQPRHFFKTQFFYIYIRQYTWQNHIQHQTQKHWFDFKTTMHQCFQTFYEMSYSSNTTNDSKFAKRVSIIRFFFLTVNENHSMISMPSDLHTRKRTKKCQDDDDTKMCCCKSVRTNAFSILIAFKGPWYKQDWKIEKACLS